MYRFIGFAGILALLGIAYAISTNRRAIRWKTVGMGLTLQFLFALFVLDVAWGRTLFSWAGDLVNHVLENAFAGSQFVFGEIGAKNGKLGFFFAFQVLPTIIFVSALFAVLYHFGIMQFVIKQVAKVMIKMGASGAESLNVAASIFVGQTEAPLTIRPFLPSLTRSELMTVMTAGMAHVSGGIMGAYILFGIEAKHLLAAVIMTAPGTILMAKMLVPETEQPLTAPGHNPPGAAQAPASLDMDDALKHKDENVLGAIARGTTDGMHLALNVAAMLISFLALIALTNLILGSIHRYAGWFPMSLEQIFGVLFAPIALLIGVPWHDAVKVGNLLGTRMVINELVAFGNLGQIHNQISERAFTIATFALCGFANFSSIGIQIGGISALAPNKRGELARLGFRAMLAGTMANLMSAAIVGILMK
jgi:CNT family concentrative nucleoside transporter